jgi:hypothetical protein
LPIAVPISAQTASTSTVAGTIFDSSGATIAKAKVELLERDTGGKATTTTDADGEFTFPAVRPGNYKVTVTAAGFRQAVIAVVKVGVGKSALLNVILQLGPVTEVVQVTAGAGIELQMLNASVGNILDSNLLSQLPTLNHDAMSLFLLQPMAIPGFNGPGQPTGARLYGGTGESNVSGGTVAGARADQHTFMIDGGDATSNLEGGGGWNTGFAATPRAVVPTPVESLEEFRVQTNNAGVDYTRSGAQVQMVTKRGTNDWHGAGYWYHQNDELNANDWFRNYRGEENPEWRDNRYGGRVGGPIWKNRTFFFVHEEERHFLTHSVFQRLVPTAALRAGILKFKDGTGVVRAYNLNPVATLDPPSGSATDNDPQTGTMIASSGLDPRGIGINPAITAEWNLLPLPNDFSATDGLRSGFFTSTSPNLTNEHFAVVRLDHKVSDKWDFMGSYRYGVTDAVSPVVQVDIGGLSPGCRQGVPCPVAKQPLQPRYLVTGLIGRLTPNLVNEFHFDWLRHWWQWSAPGVGVQVISPALSDTRLQIWSESRVNGMVPINVDTQSARKRVWNGRDFTFIDNLNWIRGKHAWQFGGRAQIEHFLHVRDDKVFGGLTTPLYYVARGGDFSNLSIGSAFKPAECASNTSGVNCVRPSDFGTNYNRAYISALGLVDSATQILTRAGDLTPQPPFTDIIQHENVHSYELYFSDIWRVKPSLTLTYGLTWGVQMPPYDPTAKTAMMIDVSNSDLVTADQLLNAKKQAGLNGVVFNPTFGYVPIEATGRRYLYDPDYTNVGPRLAAAWNPSFSNDFLSNVFGNRKTVIRAGWARAFDRINGVSTVLPPSLGIGFGDLSVCRTPSRAGACNAGGTPANNFRIGVDGNHLEVPQLPPASALDGVIIPGFNSIYENKDFRIDPRRQVGGEDMFDLTIQRELPGSMLLEVGYVGRIARDLVQTVDLNQIPYMFTPKGTKQTFAQAFDAVAAQLQAGISTTAVTSQPWFEAMMPANFCAGFASCTAAAAQYDQDNGNPYWPSHGAGGVWRLLEPFFPTGPMTAAANQVASLLWITSHGHSNYQAAFVTLRKRPSHGLTFDVNYTLSHSLDTLGETQENTCTIADAFYVNRNYGPSLFDRRHVFNMLLVYDLPFGRSKGRATGPLADRLLGGWTVSSVYTAASGLPLMVIDSNACATEFGGTTSFWAVPVGLLRTKSGSIGTSRYNNPTPGTFGTDSTDNGFPNAFGNPDAVAAQFRYPTFADNRLGLGAIRGLFRWNVDFQVAKTTRINDRVTTRFDAQFINAFNHPMFSGNQYFSFEPGTDFSSPESFGVLNSQFNSPRFIQVGFRIDF